MHAIEARPPAWTLADSAALGPVPILGIRALRYEADGRPGALPPIAGLRITAQGVPGAVPRFEPTTGQTFFADLPPGGRRILVTDPEQRFLPAALQVEVPARHPARPTAAGADLPRGAPPRLAVLLRPHPARAVPDGVTALIGTVRDAAGRAVPLARIACVTAFEGRAAQVVTFAGPDGAFVLLLPGEALAPPPMLRGLTLYRPNARLAAALTADFLAGLPAGADGTPSAALFETAGFALHGADGTPSGAPAGQAPLRPGRTARWDIVLAD
jgi:hypothetical protein